MKIDKIVKPMSSDIKTVDDFPIYTNTQNIQFAVYDYSTNELHNIVHDI